MFQNYLLTAGVYALVAAGCVVGFCVLLALKSEVRRLRSRVASQDLKSQMEEISIRLRDAEERAGLLVAPAPIRSGLNLNKRSQVIRLSRRGERPDAIAASLSLPRRQVDLLLKVHGMVLSSTNETLS